MITPGYARTLAEYNRWMNGKVYAACERLSDAQRKADAGAFFRSIHSTLNHILWGDYMWLGRFTAGTALAKEYPKGSIGTDLYGSWDDLTRARAAMDEDLLAWAGALEPAWLAGDFSWYSGITRSNRTRPAWLLVTHLFNHQTHHRGQVTTLLSQHGIDPGDTDLMLMPLPQ